MSFITSGLGTMVIIMKVFNTIGKRDETHAPTYTKIKGGGVYTDTHKQMYRQTHKLTFSK
jgi:hypothetical protein